MAERRTNAIVRKESVPRSTPFWAVLICNAREASGLPGAAAMRSRA